MRAMLSGTQSPARALRPILLVAAVLLALSAPAGATSRVKDIVDFEGVREQHAGRLRHRRRPQRHRRRLRNAPFTKQSLEAMLERLGVNTRGANLNTKNVAAVMVTATLPPFAAPGQPDRRDGRALGDAKSLLGGTLLVTPLLGADGQAYAVAQGTVAIGGFRPGRGRRRSPGRADRRPDRRRGHRRARDRLRARRHEAACGWPCATRTSPPPAASPTRSTSCSAADDRPADRSRHRALPIPPRYRGT